MKLVFDIETDDLDATKIWCICAYDLDKEKMYSFGPDKITEGVEFLKKADKIIGHNIIGFDIPVIHKLTGVDLSSVTISDTLVLSRLFSPTREGNHGLESWGYRLGFNKIDFKTFSEYSSEMLKYCENDVLLNAKVYDHLKKESKGFSKQSVELEHEVAWVLARQREHGFLLDVKGASLLVAKFEEQLIDLEKEVRKTFKAKRQEYTLRAMYTKAGKLSTLAKCRELNKKVRLDPEEKEAIKHTQKITRVIETDFNLGSRKQIGEYLKGVGWKPKTFTPTGQPIVDEGILNKIKNIPEAKLIAEYLMLQKRIGQVSSWIKEVHEEDNRVRGFVNPNGAVTGRMTHSNPNVAATPSIRAKYGSECRSCWTVPEGYKLVGIDASGLELRMLAHYMNDEDYINEVINGDVHSANQRLAGLESRDKAKTFIYALCYGARDRKLSTILEKNTRDTKRIREQFLNNLPSFKSLKDRVGRASSRGFLKGLDNRKLFVRSEHSSLNTLLQGAGAIVMKQALILFEDYIKDLKANCVANIHDEWQVEVQEDQADEVGKKGVEAIINAGKFLNLKCPLDGEYNVGRNWSETH